MAVICFLDGGSAAVSHFAAWQTALVWGQEAEAVGYLSTGALPETPLPRGVVERTVTALSSRQLISGIAQLEQHHRHVVVDVSGAPDHTVALALALSDFALIPLCLDLTDHRAFADAVDLIRIVTANMRRSLKHSVYLASGDQTVAIGTKVQVSGLLAHKGLSVVPAPLCGWNTDQTDILPPEGGTPSQSHAVFVHSVFDMVNRDFTPVKRLRRFG